MSASADSSIDASKKTKYTNSNMNANNIKIRVKEDTNIIGALIASIDADGYDNNNLTLNTNTLSVSSLINRDDAKSIGGGVSASGTLVSAGDKNQLAYLL